MNLSDPTKPSEQISPQESILQMTGGFFIAQSIFVAAQLGIADLLRDGPKHCDELATATNTHQDSLYRLLRALAGVKIFSETQPKVFDLTPMAACLQNNMPGSLRNFILLRGEYHFTCWRDLRHSLETGESASEHVYGMKFFQYLRQNTGANKVFNQATTESSVMHNDAVLGAYDFSSIEKLADIGGGQGCFLSEILLQYPDMRGLLFDLPHVIEKAETFLQKVGLGNRCDRVSGDFLDFVPAGADAYLLKHIIHNWDDQNALKILQNCHQAMGGKGRLLLIETVISENTSWRSKFKDLNMMLLFSGRVRTEDEFQELLEKAGFRLTRIVPTKSLLSVIEGVACT